jgi:hypothetical protein|tara:strand:+ start:481 stop:813 length:333 start_codon:yes stop_codon:yes gene_type:complete
MSHAELARAMFSAPAITISGTKRLCGSTFKHHYDLTDEIDAEHAVIAFQVHVASEALWIKASEDYAAEPERWLTCSQCYDEHCDGLGLRSQPDHPMRNPTTEFKVIKHHK